MNIGIEKKEFQKLFNLFPPSSLICAYKLYTYSDPSKMGSLMVDNESIVKM